MRVLVTGATGFLGTQLTRALLENGHTVFGTTRGLSRDLTTGVQGVSWDMMKPLNGEDFPQGIEAVIATAQATGYRDLLEDGPEMLACNVRAQAELLDWAARTGSVRHFTLVSSGTVYEPYKQGLSEDSPVAPTGYLGASKLASEILAKPFDQKFAVFVPRLFFPYGPGQTSRLIPTLVERIAAGQPLTLPIDDDQGMTITPTYADDIVAMLIEAMTQKWLGTVNLATPEIVSIRSMGDTIGDVMGREVEFEHVAPPAPKLVPDLSLLGKKLNGPLSQFFTPFRQGIEKTIAALT